MKNRIATTIVALVALFALTSMAEAGPQDRRISYTKSCGHHVYETPVLVGYDSCRRPVYRYVQQASSCGCSSRSSHSRRSIHSTSGYRSSSSYGHGGRSSGYSHGRYTPSYHRAPTCGTPPPVYRRPTCGTGSGVGFSVRFGR